MEREKHQISDMDGGFGTSRRLAALHTTGEGGETVKETPLIYDATNSNPLGRFVADGKGTLSRINLRSRAMNRNMECQNFVPDRKISQRHTRDEPM